MFDILVKVLTVELVERLCKNYQMNVSEEFYMFLREVTWVNIMVVSIGVACFGLQRVLFLPTITLVDWLESLDSCFRFHGEKLLYCFFIGGEITVFAKGLECWKRRNGRWNQRMSNFREVLGRVLRRDFAVYFMLPLEKQLLSTHKEYPTFVYLSQLVNSF